MPTTLKCPACDLALEQQADNGWRCANGHQFDRARRGYINLLLAQHRRSRDPGDDKAMVRARTDFLELGRYQPLLESLRALLQGQPQRWLDIGCGEGWYTAQLAGQLGAQDAVGVDISKHAIDRAARRDKALTWLVASGARLPLFAGSQQAVFVLFTRLFSEEIARVLEPGGQLYVVGTGKDHLLPLRQALYQEVRQAPFDSQRFLQQDFLLEDEQTLQFQWQPADLAELRNLLAMTPHHWRASPDAKAGLADLLGTPMQAHFVLQRWRKKAVSAPAQEQQQSSPA